MKNIENKLFTFLLISLAFLPMKKARPQGPPPVEELRGFVDLSSENIDSVFAFNKRNNNLLASSALMYVDTVTASGDTVTVPNGYRFVMQGQAGVTQGDTLYFKARDISDTDYGLRPKNSSTVIFEPGKIKRVDMKVYSSDVKSEDDIGLPRGFKLSQNYPNPFNSSTIINYNLSTSGMVSLRVYDVLGRNIKTLVEELKQDAGNYSVSFNANDLASGIYFYRLEVSGRNGENSSSGKMSLIK